MTGKKLQVVKERNSPRGLVPACGAKDTDEPYEAYLAELDPRGSGPKARALHLALAAHPEHRFQEAYRRLMLPRCRNWRLSTVFKSCEISLPEIVEFWRKAQNMRTLAKYQDAIYDIADDVISDARRGKEMCGRCDGFGFVQLTEGDREMLMANKSPEAADQIRACPACHGDGYMPKPGDNDARRMVMEMSGHGAKKGAAVQITQNFTAVESAVSRMNSITFDVEAEPVAEPIDIEAVFSESES